jgi:molecular chaperone GrpE
MMEKGKWFSKMAEKVKKTKQETAEETAETVKDSKAAAPEEKAAPEAELQEEELNNLKAENEELKNKLLRQMAEFDNYKKRTAKEKDELYQYAKADCVEAILGVIDNFERALDTQCSDENFKKGVEMIFTQFQNTLEKLGVEEIKALGEPFDPQVHNAVSQVEDENFGENIVSQVFQKGYKLGDKVIRHAMVVVANS